MKAFIKIPVEKELPAYYRPVFVILENEDREYYQEFQAWLASDGDNYIWTINKTNVIIEEPTYWLKEIDLPELMVGYTRFYIYNIAQAFDEEKFPIPSHEELLELYFKEQNIIIE